MIERGTNSPEGIHRFNYLTLTMALHHLGRTAEAQQALAEAEQAIDQWSRVMLEGSVGSIPLNWWDWLECLLLYREASKTIKGSAPPDDSRLAVIRQRALAAISGGDTTTLMAAARELAKQQAWDEAAANFVKVLDQLAFGFRAFSPEMRCCVEMVQQPEVFDRLTNQRPGDPRLWVARGRINADQGDWAKAAADYAKTLELRNEEWLRAGRSQAGGDWSRAGRGRMAVAHDLAALRLLTHQEAEYRELCAKLMTEHNDVDDAVSAHLLSRLCTLAPSAVTDWSIPIQLAKQAVTKEPNVAWHLYALAAAQFRAGQTAEAVQNFEKSLEVHPSWIGRGQNYGMLALTCHKLGRHNEARQWLAQAKTWLEESNQTKAKSRFGYAASDYLTDWLCAQVLLREAEAVLR